jgi:hypothetical protein
MKILLLCLLLAACATEPEVRPKRINCPELPLMRPEQTPRQYALTVIEMYNDCRDSLK